MFRSEVRLRSYNSRQLSDKHCCPAKAACSVRYTFATLLNARVVNEPAPLKSCVKHQSQLACRPAINLAAPRTAATQTTCKAYLEQFPSGSLLQLEAVVAALLALLLLVFQQRPRGWCNHTFVKVAQSQTAGQGVFANRDISQGTVIGAYPGVPCTTERMLQKATIAPNCKRYVFQTTSNVWLDPTDSRGELTGQSPFPGWNFDVSMAYMNEPPVGQSVNVQIVDGKDDLDLMFQTSCDISAGDELFLDYGSRYDRSGYQQGSI